MNGASPQPEITVLITAHNEADRIQPCLRSIVTQDFPMERVEILLVDDRSTDGTADRARELGIRKLRVLRQDDVPEKLTARQAALDLGFREARGEIVLVTDAGGRVPREWIRELTGHLGYRDGAATAPIVFAGGQPFFARYQTLDTLVLLTMQRWANRHGKPTGILSANMAVRREAYLETGGFPVIGFALSEDLALGEALCRAGWSVRYLSTPATQNPACRNLRELLARARRRAWNLSPAVRSLNLLLILTNVTLIALWLGYGGFWTFAIIIRYLLGMALIGISTGQYGATNLLHWVWLYEPLMTVQGLYVFPANLFSPHWLWGGLRYDRPEGKPEQPGANPTT